MVITSAIQNQQLNLQPNPRLPDDREMVNYNIGQSVFMVSNYGVEAGVHGTVVGIERDEQDTPLALIIQPPFAHSVYLDLRDEGFTIIPATATKQLLN
jgi:hypothetical protein